MVALSVGGKLVAHQVPWLVKGRYGWSPLERSGVALVMASACVAVGAGVFMHVATPSLRGSVAEWPAGFIGALVLGLVGWLGAAPWLFHVAAGVLWLAHAFIAFGLLGDQAALAGLDSKASAQAAAAGRGAD